jgi:2,3-bisphosphoglycerate-dependent phosphoglycerate mutase
VPLVYELNADLRPVRHYYLGNADEIAAKMAAVAAQASVKK